MKFGRNTTVLCLSGLDDGEPERITAEIGGLGSRIVSFSPRIGNMPRIPKSFWTSYGSEISSPISLTVPTGVLWKVELTKCADGTWLHNGWSEFAKHYSLSYGSFLLFRYEGNCNFYVIVCDKSATEISYPYGGILGSSVPNRRGFQEHAMEDDKLVEILDDIQPSKKTRIRSPSPSSRPHKKINMTSKDDTASKIMSVRSPSPSSVPHKTIKSTSNISIGHSLIIPNGDSAKRSGKRPQQMKDCRRTATLLSKERAKALQRASWFKSENPFFVVVMQPWYVHDKRSVSLPVNFCRKYLPKHNGDVILSVSHKNSRSVLFCPSVKPKLYRGWKQFVMENHLEVEDVCVFELIDQTKITFNVVIIRRVQDTKTGQNPAKDGGKCVPSSSKPILKSTKTASARQRLASFKSENPFFVITTRPSNTLKVPVPYSFIKEHIEQDAVSLTLENGGKLWPVKVLLYEHRARRSAYLSGGWRAFARENSVKAGQDCAFELINREDGVLLRVHILSKSAK